MSITGNTITSSSFFNKYEKGIVSNSSGVSSTAAAESIAYDMAEFTSLGKMEILWGPAVLGVPSPNSTSSYKLPPPYDAVQISIPAGAWPADGGIRRAAAPALTAAVLSIPVGAPVPGAECGLAVLLGPSSVGLLLAPLKMALPCADISSSLLLGQQVNIARPASFAYDTVKNVWSELPMVAGTEYGNGTLWTLVPKLALLSSFWIAGPGSPASAPGPATSILVSTPSPAGSTSAQAALSPSVSSGAGAGALLAAVLGAAAGGACLTMAGLGAWLLVRKRRHDKSALSSNISEKEKNVGYKSSTLVFANKVNDNSQSCTDKVLVSADRCSEQSEGNLKDLVKVDTGVPDTESDEPITAALSSYRRGLVSSRDSQEESALGDKVIQISHSPVQAAISLPMAARNKVSTNSDAKQKVGSGGLNSSRRRRSSSRSASGALLPTRAQASLAVPDEMYEVADFRHNQYEYSAADRALSPVQASLASKPASTESHARFNSLSQTAAKRGAQTDTRIESSLPNSRLGEGLVSSGGRSHESQSRDETGKPFGRSGRPSQQNYSNIPSGPSTILPNSGGASVLDRHNLTPLEILAAAVAKREHRLAQQSISSPSIHSASGSGPSSRLSSYSGKPIQADLPCGPQQDLHKRSQFSRPTRQSILSVPSADSTMGCGFGELSLSSGGTGRGQNKYLVKDRAGSSIAEQLSSAQNSTGSSSPMTGGSEPRGAHGSSANESSSDAHDYPGTGTRSKGSRIEIKGTCNSSRSKHSKKHSTRATGNAAFEPLGNVGSADGSRSGNSESSTFGGALSNSSTKPLSVSRIKQLGVPQRGWEGSGEFIEPQKVSLRKGKNIADCSAEEL